MPWVERSTKRERGALNLVINFGAGTFLPLVVDYLAADSEDWVALDPDFQDNNEYPTFHYVPLSKQPRKSFNLMKSEDSLGRDLPRGGTKLLDGFREAFYTSIDRVFLKPLSMSHRERLLFQYFYGFYGFLKANSQNAPTPGKAFFPATPHFHWDIALSAALQALGWRVYSFGQSPFNDRLLLRQIRGAQCSLEFEKPPIQKFSDRVSPTINANLLTSKSINAQVLNSAPPFGRRIIQILKGIRWLIAPKRFEYFSFQMLGGFVFGLQWFINWHQLRTWLNRKGIRDIPNQPFVYFALHLQPERSTVPDAGNFWYQAYAIAELRQTLPSNFLIIVGEHPQQIGRTGPDLRQRNFRSSKDYDLIVSMPNVEIAHWGLTSSALIREAELTASCTGSAGWESLCSGKPAICFAPTWYSNVQACLEWSSDKVSEGSLAELMSLDPNLVQESVKEVFARAADYSWPGLDTFRSEPKPGDLGYSDEEWVAARFATALSLSQNLQEFAQSTKQKPSASKGTQ